MASPRILKTLGGSERVHHTARISNFSCKTKTKLIERETQKEQQFDMSGNNSQIFGADHPTSGSWLSCALSAASTRTSRSSR